MWKVTLYEAKNGDGIRPIVFSRYAGPGSHRYPIGFSGDTIVTWESLQFQPYFTATASNIGYGWWSHDIGGHMFGYRDDEMEARWYQLGVFSPIMRLHSTQNEFLGKEPWRFPLEIHQVMNDFLRLRHKLIPYLYTMNYRSYADSEPLVEPLYYQYPDAEEAYNVKNSFFFGTELLAFPVTTPRIPKLHVAKTKGWLPAGTFIDIFNGMIYQSDKERKVNFYRDIASLPVLAKAGGIVPMTDEIYGEAASRNPESLRIRVYAGADGDFRLYEDDNETCGYEEGRWAVTPMKLTWGERPVFEVGAVAGESDLIPEKRNLTLEFWGVTESQVKVLDGGREVECEIFGADRREAHCETSTKTDRETIGTDTETAEKILRLMKEEPAITAKMIAKQLELSVSGVCYHINKLKKDGVVEHIGSSKKGTWLIHK